MKGPSRAVLAMPPSGIREVMDLAAGRPDVLHLEVGEPGFPTPPHVVEAAARAAADGYTKYTPNRGLPSLREAIRVKLAERNRIDAPVEDVIVTTGGVTAIWETLVVLVEPGQLVLIPDLAWPNYAMMATALGARIGLYPLVRACGFEPDLDALAALARRRDAKVVVVNSPGNPTGSVWSRETLERVLELACANDLYLLSDEVYDELVLRGEHWSPASAGENGRVVAVYSVSKTYAMTGWRIGYLVAPPEIAALVAKVQEPIVGCASSVAQKAAEAALTGPQDCVAEMRAAYRARRDAAVRALRRARMLGSEPDGAFYVLADVVDAVEDTAAFAQGLVAEHGVAVAPGVAFGPGGSGFLRLSYGAADSDALAGAVERMRSAADEWVARAQGVPAAAGAPATSAAR